MTQDEIIEMALKADTENAFDLNYTGLGLFLQRFAKLVAEKATAKEREACAKVCDDKHDTWRWDNEADSASGPRDCAAAIRARK
jgi:hypothetical protein